MIPDVTSWPIPVSLADLLRDARRVTASGGWKRGAYGQSISLPAPEQIHPRRRHAYENHPPTGLLERCPAFRAVFEEFACEKVSFRLLRRGPDTAYGWHHDRWRGPGVVRFQIPIVSSPEAFLVLTTYRDPAEIRPAGGGLLTPGSFAAFAAANPNRFRCFHLEVGRLHYFDTSRVHSLVNPGGEERIALCFDLLANGWLKARHPEILGEIAENDGAERRSPGTWRLRVERGVANTVHPLRTRVRAWLGRDPRGDV